MQSAQSVVILPAAIQNVASSYLVTNDIGHNKNNTGINNCQLSNNSSNGNTLIILSSANQTAAVVPGLRKNSKLKNSPASNTVKRQQPIKPKLKQVDEAADLKKDHKPQIEPLPVFQR